MVVLVGITSRMVEPDSQPSDPKAAERAEKLAALKESDETQLNQLATLDEKNQVVQLPIDMAIDVMLKEWEDPTRGRQWLLARYERMKGDISSMQTLYSGGEIAVDETSTEDVSSDEVVDFFGGSDVDSSDTTSFDDLESFDSFDSGSSADESVDFEGDVDDAFGDF